MPPNRYEQIIERIFFSKYQEGMRELEFIRQDGSNRKRPKRRSTLDLEPAAAAPVFDLASVAVTNGSANGNGKHPVLH
jgi:hypothetical protein